MRLQRFLRVFLAAVALAAVPGTAEANFLFPSVDTSNPTNSETNVNRQVGRKGLLYRFRYTNDLFADIPGGFPLDLSAATVTLKIGVAPTLTCTAGSNPAAGQCSFRNVDGETADGELDFVEILHNGDFPASTTIEFAVSGAEAADGVTTQDGGTPNTVSFTTGAGMPRDTASLELVFDVSGSMGWAAVPGGSVKRIDALKTAAQRFFVALEDHAILGDKIGSVFFDNTAVAFDPTPGGTNLEPAHHETQVDLVANDLQLRMPGGSTSIGDGLQVAESSGFSADPSPNLRKYALLFSDGEQNTAPLIDVPDGALCGAIDLPLKVAGVNYPADTAVCPITAGRMAAPCFTLQQSIADALCDGKNAHIRDTEETFVQADLDTYFAQALMDVLVGDKLEMAVDLTGTVQRGQTRSHAFQANPEDLALSVSLSWSGRAEQDHLSFELEAPDGTVVDLGTRLHVGHNSAFATLRFPLSEDSSVIAPEGEWEVRLSAIDTSSPELSYHLMVLLDNASLASEFSAGTSDPGTGEDISISVTLTESGAPVTGATVVAHLEGPEEGLGDVLSESGPGNPPPADSGQNPVFAGKLQALLDDPSAADLLALADLGIVPLKDPDGDGVYIGAFGGANADEEGHYHFVVDVQAEGTRNGPYQRTRRLSVFVRPKPDPAETDLVVSSVQRVGQERSVMILATFQATPRDRFRNRIGPGYIGSLQIHSSSGTVHDPLKDLGDGTYEITYQFPEGADPEVTLEVLGEEIEGDRASDLPGGGALRRNRLSLHAGYTDPHGTLAAGADGSWSAGLDYRFPLVGALSGELYLGHDRFDAMAGGDDPYFTLLTGRLRWTLGGTVVRPSLFAGVGPILDQDDDLLLGLEVGAAVEVPVGSNVGLELSYAHRNVDTSLDYGVAQVGVLIGF